MSLNSRLTAVERERGRWCSKCGGPLVAPVPLPDLADMSRALTDQEKIALYLRAGCEHLMPARLRELAERMGATS